MSSDAFKAFTDRLQNNGALLSYRAKPDGTQAPYEANVTLFSALERCAEDLDGTYAVERYIAAHTIMFALEGVPAVYFNSLFGQTNDTEAVEASQIPRRINRTKYQLSDVELALGDASNHASSHASRVFDELKRLLSIRAERQAFHPNATQFTLQLPRQFFGIWRQSLDRRANLFAVTNLSAQPHSLPSSSINLVTGERWLDLLDQSAIQESDLEIQFQPYQTRWIARTV